jgi:hypothetical protein
MGNLNFPSFRGRLGRVSETACSLWSMALEGFVFVGAGRRSYDLIKPPRSFRRTTSSRLFSLFSGGGSLRAGGNKFNELETQPRGGLKRFSHPFFDRLKSHPVKDTDAAKTISVRCTGETDLCQLRKIIKRVGR